MDKIQTIIDAYHEIGSAMNNPGAIEKLPVALDEMEAALTDIDANLYTARGQGFISDMGFYHHRAWEIYLVFENTPALLLERLKDHHLTYRSDIIEAEAIMTPKLTTYALRPGLEVAGASQ